MKPIALSVAIVLALLSLLLSASPAAASEKVIDDLTRRLEEVEAKLQAMEDQERISSELADLREQVAALAKDLEELRIGTPERDVEPIASPELGAAASKVYRTERGVSIGGYGELLYQAPDSRTEGGDPSDSLASADFLRAVLYTGYKFNDRILFNSELEVEHANTEEHGAVEMEFGYLDFGIRKELSARAGMVLVPMGIVNEFHEPPSFLSARRPLVERLIIPATWSAIGAGVYGDIGDFSYRAFLVNGLDAGGFSASGIRGGRQHGSKEIAEDFAVTGRLDWHGISGLTLGGSFYTGDAGQGAVTPASSQALDAKTSLLDLHAIYQGYGLQARALYVAGKVDDAALVNEAAGFTGSDSVGSRQKGYYGEVGYDLLSLTDRTEMQLIPFVRFEWLNPQDEVPDGFLSDPENDMAIRTFGLAWKPIANAVVKLDFQDISNEADTGVDQWNLALGWLF